MHGRQDYRPYSITPAVAYILDNYDLSFLDVCNLKNDKSYGIYNKWSKTV